MSLKKPQAPTRRGLLKLQGQPGIRALRTAVIVGAALGSLAICRSLQIVGSWPAAYLSDPAPVRIRTAPVRESSSHDPALSERGAQATVAAKVETAASDSRSGFEARRAEEEKNRRLVAYYDAAVFGSSGSDPVSSAAISEELARTVTVSELQGVHIGDVDCQPSLCRVEVAGDQQGAMQRLLIKLAQTAAFRGGQALVAPSVQKNGVSVTPIFASRAGYALPDPD
jgi:hypothetical protein